MNLLSPSKIIFLLTLATSLYGIYVNKNLSRQLSLHPYSFWRGEKIYGIITSGFVHAHIPHLFLNLLSYYFFAFRLESMVGPFAWTLIYFVGLIFSDITTIIKNKNNYSYYSLGASGAISSLLFSYILFEPSARLIIFPIPFSIPAYIFAFLYLGYSYYASKNSNDSINHEAHFYGALAGILTTLIIFPSVFRYFVEKIFG